MISKNSRRTTNWRDCEAPVEHLNRSKDTKRYNEEHARIFGKQKYWFEEDDRWMPEEKKNTNKNA